MDHRGQTWSEDQLLVVFRLYCRTPFGRLHQRNLEIIELARLIGRTPAAVAMKACNFASLDPRQHERNIVALGNVSRADRRLWDRFTKDSETIAADAQDAFERLSGREGEIEEEVEWLIPEGPTEVETLVKARRVQSFFRAAVLASYEGRCALTGIRLPELLNAAHIIPWHVAPVRRADPTNGLCLNTLHDRAFDRGLLTFDEHLRAVISPRVRDDDTTSFQTEVLMKMAGRKLRQPSRFPPDLEALDYHRNHIFKDA